MYPQLMVYWLYTCLHTGPLEMLLDKFTRIMITYQSQSKASGPEATCRSIAFPYVLYDILTSFKSAEVGE